MEYRTPGYAAYPPRTEGRFAARIRVFVGVVTVAFVVTLAVMVGQRLSDQAVAVLAGAVCGVGASIPTSLLIAWTTRRRQEQVTARSMAAQYPPVVVVQQPPQQAGLGAAPQPGYLGPYLPPAQREFTVVGGGMEERRYGSYQ